MSARVRSIGLDPRGTASVRSRVLAGAPSFSEALRASVREYDLPEEALYLAWQIARLSDDKSDAITGAEREALFHLALVTLINVRQGSTRVPLPSVVGQDNEGRYLDELLLSLKLDAKQRAAVIAMSSSLSSLPSVPSLSEALRGHNVVGVPGDYRPLILDGNHLYQQRMLNYEQRLVTALGDRLRANAIEIPAVEIMARERALTDVLARPPQKNGRDLVPSHEQLAAVRKALGSRLTVISGGPGTGKTSIVVSILRALVRSGVPIESVALAAPTGKAANRMDEAIKHSLRSVARRDAADEQILTGCPAPKTLHRLLGYMPSTDRYKHHGNNRLAEQVVIIDECSMIDLYLMDQLVRSVRDDARLILLGDADQLPSVDAGAVFRDLIPPVATEAAEVSIAAAGGTTKSGGDVRASAAVRLTRSYRMDPSFPEGLAILTAAQLINASDAGALLSATGTPEPPLLRRANPDALRFEKVELLDDGTRDMREAFFAAWYRRRVASLPDYAALVHHEYRHGIDGFHEVDRLRLASLFAHVEGHRILCLTRGDGRPTGAEAVNEHLHRLALEAEREGGDAGLRGRPHLIPGEPVMMQRNDYDRGLWNGDQGLILRVSESGAPHHFMAVFPRGDDYAAFHLDSLRADLRLSFAITVHKAQGSEFDHVALILPDEELPILTRELLYTAVTRSRRSVVILGKENVLKAGVLARLRRYSGIGERLANSGHTFL